MMMVVMGGRGWAWRLRSLTPSDWSGRKTAAVPKFRRQKVHLLIQRRRTHNCTHNLPNNTHPHNCLLTVETLITDRRTFEAYFFRPLATTPQA